LEVSLSIVGVDIGGTFTDLVGYENGRIITSKTSTVPADPTEGVAESLRLANCDISAIGELLHGSTIAINTVLERKGAKTALITTEGFRDIYAIGRNNRPDAFNVMFKRPRPLVTRDLTFEVAGRMTAAGEELTPLDEARVVALGEQMVKLGVEAVAVCFMHAYNNPAHEAAAGAILRTRFPKLFVTLSHEILREYREYERTSTTALNAFVGPRVDGYLGRLERFVLDRKFAGKIQIMRSNGGTMSIDRARREPVGMMESGPVAGMIGAGRLASLMGWDSVIGFDMGGTTAKATLITGGLAPIEEGYVIGDEFTGQPMQLPVVDIVEVGAGGGSIAWVDATGGLRVGPVSAGADPGPVCYGRGAEEPVVTDADLVLGRLNGDRFLGGAMHLDRGLAAAAIQKKIAEPLGLDVVEAALGVARIADAAMSLAVRAVSVNRGIDPRDAVMIAFGGAGPLHAIAIAKEIYIPTVVIPKLPGNFSALGMLMAEWRQDFVRTLFGQLGKVAVADAERAFAELRQAGEEILLSDRFEPGSGHFAFAADLRYRGQEHTIPIPVPNPAALTTDTAATRALFDEQHDKRYGHAETGQLIEIVNLRLVVTVPRMEDTIGQWLSQPWEATETAVEQSRKVVFEDPANPVDARVLWRPALPAGTEIVGPAVIEEPNSTILIHPGDTARITEAGHIVVTLASQE
jgi:N-methylhydantoinase A